MTGRVQPGIIILINTLNTWKTTTTTTFEKKEREKERKRWSVMDNDGQWWSVMVSGESGEEKKTGRAETAKCSEEY